jgi:hypothetical protein
MAGIGTVWWLTVVGRTRRKRWDEMDRVDRHVVWRAWSVTSSVYVVKGPASLKRNHVKAWPSSRSFEIVECESFREKEYVLVDVIRQICMLSPGQHG